MSTIELTPMNIPPVKLDIKYPRQFSESVVAIYTDKTASVIHYNYVLQKWMIVDEDIGIDSEWLKDFIGWFNPTTIEFQIKV